MPRVSYVNGRYVPHGNAAVHIEDRGFQFADGVYEVIALINGILADERGHLERLERSARELQIKLPMSRKALKIVIRELTRRNRLKNATIYIQLTRGQAPRDFKFPSPDTTASLVMVIRPLGFEAMERKTSPKKVITVPDMRWKRRDIKTVALLPQALAKQQAVKKAPMKHGWWMTRGM